MFIEITRSINQKGIDVLKEAGIDFSVGSEDLTREELLNFFSGHADAIIVNGHLRVDDKYLDAVGSNIKILANHGVGYDHFDLDEIRARGIIATNTPDVLTQAVTEHTWGLIISLVRDIPGADQIARLQTAEARKNMPVAIELSGRNLGILGMGRIGSRVAHIADAIGMNIFYHDIERKPSEEFLFKAKFLPTVEDLIKLSDVLSIHVPLDESTRGMINNERLALMRRSAYLINTSRGEVVDEGALTRALFGGTIAGAALDVFQDEPRLYPGLANLKNVILTPHIAYRTVNGTEGIAVLAAQNVVSVLSGRDPLTPII